MPLKSLITSILNLPVAVNVGEIYNACQQFAIQRVPTTCSNRAPSKQSDVIRSIARHRAPTGRDSLLFASQVDLTTRSVVKIVARQVEPTGCRSCMLLSTNDKTSCYVAHRQARQLT